MTTRKIIIGLSGVVLLVLAVVAARGLSNSRPPAERLPIKTALKQVEVLPATNQELAAEIEVNGRLTPRKRIQVFAEVSGVLKPESSRFREGNYFKEGQPLVVIDDQEQRLNLLAQKSSLMNQITLMMPDLKTDYPANFRNWQAYLNNFELEKPIQAFPEPKSDQERYFISARNLYNLFYTIQSSEVRLEKYTIKAPFSGVVTESNITEGTLVRAAQPLGTFINSYSYEMEAAVGLDELPFFKAGNRVALTSTTIPGSWKGTILRISDRIDPNTQTARVYISVGGKGLKEGMYLNGQIEGKTIQQVVELPRDLLIAQKSVYVVQDSTMRLMEVEPVQYTNESVLVKGIPDGTQLVNGSVIGAYDGLTVAPYQSK
ncbi:MAG: efflux RND transporter periplasmic adaptor subunit [Bacteroidota bacterium]